MGYFTWTLANRKLELDRFGEPLTKCKLRYGQFGAILCPDNTIIQEPHYDGYGRFNGKDVYELVVDWNRPHLKEIRHNPDIKQRPIMNDRLFELYDAYAEQDQEKLDAIIAAIKRDNPEKSSYTSEREYKRTFGIYIACGENNYHIPYPIKIINTKRHLKYADLPPSISTQ